MKFRLLTYFLLISIASFSQLEDDTYYKESTIGLNFNTSGGLIGGITGRMAFRANDSRFNVASLEIVHVKHHKEQKFASQATGNGFIPGKTNYLFSVRPQFGQEYLLFNKYPEEGIQLSVIFAGGPSFGFVKPYYIEYDYTDYTSSTSLPIYKTEAYNPETHSDDSRILGSGGVFYGFNQMSVMLGANFKAGLNFEFGKYKDAVMGVEAGFTYEAYTQAIQLYPIENNPKSFSSVYFTIYVGIRN